MRDFPIKDQSFVLIPLHIVFTRYGKEEKRRCETREFLQILPVSLTSVYEESVTVKRIQDIIKILNKGELFKNSNWHNMACNYSSNPLNIGTVIPVGHTNVTRMDDNEAKAWIVSILRNPSFGQLVRTHRHLPTLKALVTDDLLAWVSNAVRSSSARNDLLRWAEDEPQHMRTLLRDVQCINAVFCRGVHNSSMKAMKNMIMKGRVKDINPFSFWLLTELFQDESIIKEKENIVYGASIGNNFTNLTKCMRPIRNTYLTIKPNHV